MSHFIVYGLPRSRTNWLSHFLSYGDHECRHEVTQYMRGIDDLKSWLILENMGAAETAAAPGWRLIHHYRPDIRAVVVRRPADAVVASLLRQDLSGVAIYDAERLRKGMAYLDRCLEQIEREVPGILSVRFADLEREETCARLFEHALPFHHDHAWWDTMRKLNLQVNSRALMRYRLAHRAQIDRFKTACWAELRRLAKAGAFENADAPGA